MQIAAIQKLTLLDFPGKTACTIFTPGCNFRCGYCHNPELVLPKKIAVTKKDLIPESAFFNFLEKRKGLLDGVCITGGEPMLFSELIPLCERLRELEKHITIETAATVWKDIVCDLASISPKLSHSTPWAREGGRELATNRTRE